MSYTHREFIENKYSFTYDTAKYDFIRILREIFDDWDKPIESLHEFFSDSNNIEQITIDNDTKTKFHRKYYDSPHYTKLVNLYYTFVKEVVLTLFNESDTEYLVQKDPCFRICLPNNTALGLRTGMNDPENKIGIHTDGEYNHPPGEINFMLSFGDQYGNNSCFVETQVGSDIYEPIQMKYGSFVSFYGNKCRHHNKKNDTGISRVSVDFRIIPYSKYDPSSVSESLHGKRKFLIGDYYVKLSKEINMKCTLIGHNGWTDFFSQYPLYREKIRNYKEVIIFVNEESKIPLLKALYPEDTIHVEVPHTVNNYDEYYTCLNCHTLGNKSFCPRGGGPCRYIDYSRYNDYDTIRLNAFDSYNKWKDFIEGKSFLESFYNYYSLDFIETVKSNPFLIHKENCETFYNSLSIDCDYIVIHDSNQFRIILENKDNYRIINLDSISKTIVDTVSLLEGAKELHLIDSVYGFFVLFLQIQYNLFANHKIYLYYRSTDTNGPFYAIKNYIPKDWSVIDISTCVQ